MSYPVQRAAAAIYTPEGKKEVTDVVDYYLGNAKVIRERLRKLGFTCTGGDNSPYIWVKTGGKESWEFFDFLLEKAQVVTTPGSGFGRCGEGYIRITRLQPPRTRNGSDGPTGKNPLMTPGERNA